MRETKTAERASTTTGAPAGPPRGSRAFLVTAGQTISDNRQTTSLVGLGLTVALVFTLLEPEIYGSALNLESIAYAVPEVGLLALAVAISMTSGGIDLSIVATANLAALTMASLAVRWSASGAPEAAVVTASVVAGLAVALLCGAINGLLVARIRIAPILATLATMQLFGGLAVLLTRGEPVFGLPRSFLNLGVAIVAVLPVSFWIFLAVAALLWFLINRTGFGLQLTLVGASPEAADFSGIRRHTVLIRTYMLSGLIAGGAGMMMAARSASASASYGESYVLLAITIAVLGGTNPAGGRARLAGVALGAVVLQMISSGFNLLGISPYLYQMVQGLILVSVLVAEQRSGRLVPWLRSLTRRPSAAA